MKNAALEALTQALTEARLIEAAGIADDGEMDHQEIAEIALAKLRSDDWDLVQFKGPDHTHSRGEALSRALTSEAYRVSAGRPPRSTAELLIEADDLHRYHVAGTTGAGPTTAEAAIQEALELCEDVDRSSGGPELLGFIHDLANLLRDAQGVARG